MIGPNATTLLRQQIEHSLTQPGREENASFPLFFPFFSSLLMFLKSELKHLRFIRDRTDLGRWLGDRQGRIVS
jgi:hypothetical protein